MFRDNGKLSRQRAQTTVERSPRAPVDLVRQLRAIGRDPYGFLQAQQHQVDAGVAEVFVGALRAVRLRPGDVVTSATLAATVGPDGRLYADGARIEIRGSQVRVYRPMAIGLSTLDRKLLAAPTRSHRRGMPPAYLRRWLRHRTHASRP